MNTKRISVVLGALLLICLGLVLMTSSTRYRADAMVVAMPYTNALFARSFESQVTRAMPTVLSLRVALVFSRVSGSGAPMVTNGVVIQIVAIGRTPEEANKAANEAADSIRWMVSTNYGVDAMTVEPAYGTRKYSFFHDSFQPAIGRWFKR
jgi:hypothetical protein